MSALRAEDKLSLAFYQCFFGENYDFSEEARVRMQKMWFILVWEAFPHRNEFLWYEGGPSSSELNVRIYRWGQFADEVTAFYRDEMPSYFGCDAKADNSPQRFLLKMADTYCRYCPKDEHLSEWLTAVTSIMYLRRWVFCSVTDKRDILQELVWRQPWLKDKPWLEKAWEVAESRCKSSF